MAEWGAGGPGGPNGPREQQELREQRDHRNPRAPPPKAQHGPEGASADRDSGADATRSALLASLSRAAHSFQELDALQRLLDVQRKGLRQRALTCLRATRVLERAGRPRSLEGGLDREPLRTLQTSVRVACLFAETQLASLRSSARKFTARRGRWLRQKRKRVQAAERELQVARRRLSARSRAMDREVAELSRLKRELGAARGPREVQRLTDQCKEQEARAESAQAARNAAQVAAGAAEASYARHGAETLSQLAAFMDEHGRFSRIFQRELARAVHRLARAEDAAAQAYSAAFPESQESAEAAEKVLRVRAAEGSSFCEGRERVDAAGERRAGELVEDTTEDFADAAAEDATPEAPSRPARRAAGAATDAASPAPGFPPELVPYPSADNAPNWAEWPAGQYYAGVAPAHLPLPGESVGARTRRHQDASRAPHAAHAQVAQVAQIYSPTAAPAAICDGVSAYPFMALQRPPGAEGAENIEESGAGEPMLPVLVSLPSTGVAPPVAPRWVLAGPDTDYATPCQSHESRKAGGARGELQRDGQCGGCHETRRGSRAEPPRDAARGSQRERAPGSPSVLVTTGDDVPPRSPSAPEPRRRRLFRI